MKIAEPMIPTEVGFLAQFSAAGVFEAADIQVAASIARIVGDLEWETGLAAALCVRGLRLGHVCVDLATVADNVNRQLEGGLMADQNPGSPGGPELVWPDPDRWVEVISESSALRATDVTAPLVLEGSSLYLQRYWRYEVEVAERIRDAARAPLFSTDPAPVLDVLFGGGGRQREAVSMALARRFSVMAGGPGTGKTWTISRLLAAVHELAHRERRSVEVALAAPTGKAAKRMTEALDLAITSLDVSPVVTEHLAEVEATTLHRLLGGSRHRPFQRNAEDPLTHDLVIVDEASMVDLPLMAKLIRALGARTHLVLVGDPYQLASVEAGAVLADIVDADLDVIVMLEQVHRFDAGSAIARVAEAVRSGDPDTALGILRDPRVDAVRMIDPTDTTALEVVRRELGAHAKDVVGLARAGDVAGALDLLGSRKVLCGTRFGPQGSRTWGRAIESRVDGHDRFGPYVGMPVIATRNDYVTRVMNGDTGIVVRRDDRFVMAIPDSGEVREVPMAQLVDVEPWWAMTIHKSQGSEFDHVIVSLPDADSPVLTRELLYTAITRGRTAVTVVADEAALRRAISEPVRRASGLRGRLSR